SLVDPDNRRPVDYALRQGLLNDIQAAGAVSRELARELVDSFVDGRIKLYTTWRGLGLRREKTALFLEGSYEPIRASEHIVAFERRKDSQRLVCVAPRFSRRLTGGKAAWAMGSAWRDEALMLGRAARLRDVFSGREHEGARLRLADVLADFPVAWLVEF